MPGPWNDSTDRKLLLTIIHINGAKTANWDQVAGLMGDGFTAESVRQHFQKLRKACTAEFGEIPEATKGATTKGTPRKNKSASEAGRTPKKSTGKRKERKTEEEVSGNEEQDGSPSKKVDINMEVGEENFLI